MLSHQFSKNATNKLQVRIYMDEKMHIHTINKPIGFSTYDILNSQKAINNGPNLPPHNLLIYWIATG